MDNINIINEISTKDSKFWGDRVNLFKTTFELHVVYEL